MSALLPSLELRLQPENRLMALLPDNLEARRSTPHFPPRGRGFSRESRLKALLRDSLEGPRHSKGGNPQGTPSLFIVSYSLESALSNQV